MKEILVGDQIDHYRIDEFLATSSHASILCGVDLNNGTVNHASPEEIRGRRCDSRSDVYSMGVILYEMPTGQLPFGKAKSLANVNERLVKDIPPPRKIEPSITPQMQEILYRALEREPVHRYSSAHGFGFDLAHMQDVVVQDRRGFRDMSNKTAVWTKNILIYIVIAAVPIILFVLMMLVEHRK